MRPVQVFRAVLCALVLAGCASRSRVDSGMETTLGPGRSLAIRVGSGDVTLAVETAGPGILVLSRDGEPGSESRLAVSGLTQVSGRGPSAWTIRNDSESPASVSVRIQGSDSVEIHGPVAARAQPESSRGR